MLQGKDLTIISRKLRKQPTPWEQKLWYYLRANRFMGLKFKRQVPMGNYVVDFCCQKKKLAIELDGSQHNLTTQADQNKDNFLKSEGYTVLRFWNNDLDANMEEVLETIRRACA